MNLDDFERRLQHQSMRNIPPEWRAEILSAAEPAADTRSAQDSPLHARRSVLSTLNHQLLTILWPSPKAWAGLAAVWVAILAVNSSVGGASQRLAKDLTPPPKLMLAIQQQERFSADRPAPSEAPPPVRPAPRSERRDETVAE